MRRFRFRLERVFEWQRRVCALAEDEVRSRLAAIAHTEQRIARLSAVQIAAEHDLLKRPAFTPGDLSALAHFRRKCARDQRALESRKASQLRDLEQKRVVLADERRRLRLFENLRARALSEHEAAVDKELEAIAMENHQARWIAAGRDVARALW